MSSDFWAKKMLKGLKPISRSKRFFSADMPYDIMIAGASLVGGVAASKRFAASTPPDKSAASVAFWLAVTTFFVVIFKGFKNFRLAASRDDDSPLEGLLHVVRSIVQSMGKECDPTLRIALYMRDEKGPMQRTNYIGPTKADGKYRRISMGEGVVGSAFRTGQESHSTLPIGTNVVDFLTEKQGFTRDEAARRNSDRKSWIAVPIGEPNKVFAVIYCDSALADFFGNKNSQRRKALAGAILGVAEFLTRRYS